MKSASSTQQNVPIAGIKDGIVILKNGQYRLILEVTALNYSLKSEEEQNSLVLQYQSFLNSIHFPIQIVVRSKKLDLAPYINKVKALAEKQQNELLKIQTNDYVDFVGQLINLANIMKKSFYVVVGYQPLTAGQGTILDKVFNRHKEVNLKISDQEFLHNTKDLLQRGQTVAQGLGSIGLHCKQLTTEEVIETFYGIYNPEVAGKERLTESDNFSSSFVTSAPSRSADQAEASPSPTDDQAKTIQPEITIDNKDVVIEREKNRAQERAYENDSTEKRSIGMTEPEKTSPVTDTNKVNTEKAEAVDAVPSTKPSATAPPPNSQPTAAQNIPTAPPAPATGATKLSDPTATTEQKAVEDPKLNKDYGW